MPFFFLFFFNATATPEIYTLSLHDALPISIGADTRIARRSGPDRAPSPDSRSAAPSPRGQSSAGIATRSEEHTSELQSRENLVCRLLLEKKKKEKTYTTNLKNITKILLSSC